MNMARDTQKETRVYRDAFEEMDELGRGRYTRIYKVSLAYHSGSRQLLFHPLLSVQYAFPSCLLNTT